MRTLIGAVAATLLYSTAAFAGQTEGLIKKVDKDALTLTLDDGKSYKAERRNRSRLAEAGHGHRHRLRRDQWRECRDRYAVAGQRHELGQAT